MASRTLTRCVAATGVAVALSLVAAAPGSARSSTGHRNGAIGAGVAVGAAAAAAAGGAAYDGYHGIDGRRSGYYNYAPGYYDYDPAIPYGGAPLGQQGSCHFSIAGC